MSKLANRRDRSATRGAGSALTRRKGVKDATTDHSADRTQPGSRDTHTGEPQLPPNGNIRKHAFETYGDTEIPERKGDI
jgi:hypothetical protein